MIKRTYDRASMSKKLDKVYVVTDDDRIEDHCGLFNIPVLRVDNDCATGTDRCAIASKLVDANIYVNIQGDEPLIDPEAIDRLCDYFNPNLGVANAYVTIKEPYKVTDNDVVKVVFDSHHCALYYSRLGIPFPRGEVGIDNQQLGLYAFTKERLQEFLSLPMQSLEKAESVEMLRFLEHGYKVLMVHVDDDGLSVDTPKDIKLVEERINAYN
jgi:3-deoxy-manno-octulosonate cytidylyltransferase (CMP-KDO synthetase)